MPSQVLTCGLRLTQCSDMAHGSCMAVKTSKKLGRNKIIVVAICTLFAQFDGQRFLVLEFDGKNQTRLVEWTYP